MSLAARLRTWSAVLLLGAAGPLLVCCMSVDGFATSEDPTSSDPHADPQPSTPPPDASPLRTSVGDAGPSGPFCRTLAVQPVFCEDFDEYPLSHNWPVVQTPNAATLSLDPTRYASGPNALLAKTQPVPQNDWAIATLFRSFYSSPKAEVHVAYDVRIDSSVLNAQLITHGLAFGSGPSEADLYKLSLVQGAESAYVEEALPTPTDGGPRRYNHLPMTTYLPQGRWAHVKMDVVLSGAPTLSVSIDGVAGISGVALTRAWTNLSPSLYLGIVYARGPIPDLSVHFDNLTVDMR